MAPLLYKLFLPVCSLWAPCDLKGMVALICASPFGEACGLPHRRLPWVWVPDTVRQGGLCEVQAWKVAHTCSPNTFLLFLKVSAGSYANTGHVCLHLHASWWFICLLSHSWCSQKRAMVFYLSPSYWILLPVHWSWPHLFDMVEKHVSCCPLVLYSHRRQARTLLWVLVFLMGTRAGWMCTPRLWLEPVG